jgi:hypothetical protein
MKPIVWFGRMTHGTFTIAGDSNPMVIVDHVDLATRMTEEEADDYMVMHGYDSYLMPEVFGGEIVYSDQFCEIKRAEDYV